MPMIDLRSDTVTRPSAAMRRAMADAEVGDDVFLEDPTLNLLQARAAAVFGREAGLFVPTGSMGNLTCVMAQTRPGTGSHLRNQRPRLQLRDGRDVGGRRCAAARDQGEDGVLTWDAIATAIRPKVYYRPQTSLICLENTVNMAGGTVCRTPVVEEICDRAHEHDIHVHLDGARVFNASMYLNEPVAAMTRKFDSVQFCLSKGLGAPVGSMIVGSRDFIERCRPIRKMLGGGMRQAGVLAAAGMVALEDGPNRLQDDHENAKVLAGNWRHSAASAGSLESANQHRHLQREGQRPVVGRLPLAVPCTRRPGVPVDADRVRMVTHLDVDRADMEKAAEIVESVTSRPKTNRIPACGSSRFSPAP